GATSGVPVCIADNCLFRIDFPDASAVNENLRAVAVIFFVLSISAFLLVGISLLPVVRNRSVEWGFLYLLGVFLALRWLMTGFQFPSALVDSAFFDPQVFASSAFN